jgi:hypothetical protein
MRRFVCERLQGDIDESVQLGGQVLTYHQHGVCLAIAAHQHWVTYSSTLARNLLMHTNDWSVAENT